MERLLAELRSRDRAGRERLLGEILARGSEARGPVERALAEERVLVDALEDLLERLGGPQARGGRRAGEDGALPEAADWTRAKYRLALERYLAEDTYGALQAIDAILALEPRTPLRPRLIRLRRACRERLARESVLSARLVCGEEVLTPERALRARVRLENVSGEEVRIVAAEDRRLGLVTLDYEELAPSGARTRTRVQRWLRAPEEELVLGPGQARSLPVELPSPHRRLPRGLVGRYHLAARLRARSLEVGGVPLQLFVPAGGATVLAVGTGDAGLVRNPRTAFLEAVAKASSGTLAERREPARQAFVAALVLSLADEEEALRLLASALEGARGSLSEALCAGLARVVGEPLNFSREEWLIWWKGRESRPRRRGPAGER
ncbi:MAG: hypothetical protein D6731_18490 [Planctomycetota bacterium]|nr:MAG: hypothetical protein D6731_18490 [Planctomycetota bacterium]